MLAFDETLWESLDVSSVPDWPVNEAAYDVLRDAIEVQVWLHAPVFIASRSSMSELNMLKRDPNCTLYMGLLYIALHTLMVPFDQVCTMHKSCLNCTTRACHMNVRRRGHFCALTGTRRLLEQMHMSFQIFREMSKL